MSVFGNKQKIRIAERWKYSADHSIWRIVISDNGYFVCEDRDKENKSVSFFCVEQSTGKVIWKDIRLDEAWWTGIEAVHEQYVFFHDFATPDMPDHKKIHAYDLLTGEALWHNVEAKYLFATNDAVYSSKDLFERRIFHELDIMTGSFKREIDAQTINTLLDSIPEPSMPVHFPQVIHPMHVSSENVKNALAAATAKAKNIVLLEHLEHKGLEIIGFYDNIGPDPEKPELEQFLMIFDPSKNSVLYRDKITAEVNAPIPDTFFCSGDIVYLVKDKKTLVAMDILI